MERLTEYCVGTALLRIDKNHLQNYMRDMNFEAVRKLAAYEDTGLTPEEIERLKEEHYEALDEASDLAVGLFEVVEENLKLRRLLKLAVEDITTAASDFCECSEFCEFCSFCKYRKENDICEYRMNHNDCINASGFRWKHADEVEEVLKDE